MRRKRQNESEEEAQARRDRDRLAKQAKRANQSVAELANTRTLNAQREATRRSQLSVAEASEVRARDAQAHATRRRNSNVAELDALRARNATQQSTRRAQQTEEEQAAARQTNTRQTALRRTRNANQTNSLYKRALRPVSDNDPPLHYRLVISVCEHCGARKLDTEPKGICCMHGNVPKFTFFAPSDHIIELYRGSSPAAKEFRKKIRFFNGCFALSKFECTEESRAITKDGISISGVSYQFVPALVAPDGRPLKYSQLYILDNETQLGHRLNALNSVNDIIQRSIFEQLNEFLLREHRLFATVKAAHELVQNYSHYKIVLEENNHVSPQRRQFSPVRVNELALLYPENAFREGKVPGILLNHRDGSSTRADQYSSLYTSAGYPLIFLDGSPGWGRHSVRANSKRLSLSAWSRYFYFEREGVFNPVLESCNLSKQFALDTHQRMEWVRNQWYRQNQTKLRVDTVSNVDQARESNADGTTIGKKVILTAAAKGSPNHYRKLYLDAMEIVCYYGAPSLFITITCNPKWAEIADLACNPKYAGWSENDRADLVARVFAMKLKIILADITDNKIFGKVLAYVYSIEWQKRGNPHAHCVFWLSPEDQLDTVAKVDSAISAKIPPPSQPQLRKAVLKHMVHGPCGPTRQNSPCMQDKNGTKVCSKQFPKAFCSETTIGENGLTTYARPSPAHGGETAVVNGVTIDNRSIVAHSPYLTQKYGGHINVEKVCSVKSVRYMFKYTFKGCDMATYKKVSRDSDEPEDNITVWEEGRYLSHGEAYWDIYEFARHGNYPPVVLLDLHLPGENNVVFDEETGLERVETSRLTKLTAFFELNQSNEAARGLLYRQIPAYFTFKSKRWTVRARGDRDPEVMDLHKTESLGRIPFVSPSNQEKNEVFALYLLLCHTRGPRSYEDLRTVNGVVYTTFADAAVAKNLMESEDFLERAMQDAKSHMTSKELRRFFAMLIVHWGGKDCKSFFEAHLDSLCEDLLNTARADNPEAGLDQNMINICLTEIGQALAELGCSLGEKNLPTPPAAEFSRRRELGLDLVFTLQQVNEKYATLNDDQKQVFDTIVNAVSAKQGGLYFLNASGGTGKSYLMNVIIAALCQKGLKVCPTASSGIASTGLLGGQTVHSSFKIPLNCDFTSVSHIKYQTKLGEQVRKLDCVIWDEAPMQSKDVLETLDRSFRFLRGRPDEPFGGITMLLAGDWRQILPVVKNGERPSIVAATHKRSALWDLVVELTLTANMRVRGNDQVSEAFRTFVLSVGDGSANLRIGNSRSGQLILPESLMLEPNTPSALCDFVYDNLAEMFAQSEEAYSEWISKRGILCSTNDHVDDYNALMHNKLPGREIVHLSTDRQLIDAENGGDSVEVQTHHLNSFTPSGMPPSLLRFKIGTPLMLIRNIAPASGHCNGTKYIALSSGGHHLKLLTCTGPAKGTTFVVPRIKFVSSVSDTEIKFSRVQFPVRPCFALTVHKAQGQSLERVGLSLMTDYFAHGQLYVALSRPTDPLGIKVIRPWNEQQASVDRKTQNIVYDEVLR